MPSAVAGQPAENIGPPVVAKPASSHGQQPPAAPTSRWPLSYRTSLILWLSLLVVATGVALTFLSFHTARDSTNELAEALFQEVSDHAVTKTRGFLLRAVPIAEAMGNLSDLGLATSDSDRLARQLTAMLRANPGVSWISYSNEAGDFVGAYRTPAGETRINKSNIGADGRTAMFEYTVFDDDTWHLARQDQDTGYDPRKRPFYQRAKASGRLIWPPPYIFYEQSVPGVTCANPLYDRNHKVQGVLTVDFDLNTLSTFVRQLSVSRNSKLFIMSNDGVLLAHPDRRPEIKLHQRDKGELMTVRELNDPLISAFDSQLKPEDRHPPSEADHARQFDFRHADTDYYARATAFTIDKDLVWIVGAIAPQGDFLGGARRSNMLSLGLSLAALGVAVVVAMMLARRVSGPILSLMSFMRNVGEGDLTTPADLGGPREFRHLSGALNKMIADLRDRGRMRTAMMVAMEVQQRLLPPGPPDVAGLDVYGFSAYCDETGGDYYDYITLGAGENGSSAANVTNNDRLLITVADVMGHGIASALVMATARAILRSRATANCENLGHLLSHLNELLVDDMRGRQFVTMFLCMLNPAGGTACWASAGHDPAILYDPACDQFEETGRGSLPLGIEQQVEFEQQTFPMKEGQIIVLGTDGVWETLNAAHEFYGKGRLQGVIRSMAARSAREIGTAVHADLCAFRGHASQRDDITLVVIKVARKPA